jgi:hypothetical protein
VRSRTVTIMMLLTPMTPASKVPSPTSHINSRMPVKGCPSSRTCVGIEQLHRLSVVGGHGCASP